MKTDNNSLELISLAESKALELIVVAEGKAAQLIKDAEKKAVDLITCAEGKAVKLIDDSTKNYTFIMVINIGFVVIYLGIIMLQMIKGI